MNDDYEDAYERAEDERWRRVQGSRYRDDDQELPVHSRARDGSRFIDPEDVPIHGLKFNYRIACRFLNFLANTGRFSDAARAVGTTSRTIRNYAKFNPKFGEAIEDANEEFSDRLEREAYRRAVEGVKKDIINKDGDKIGTELVYSDRLLAKMMDGANPAKYGRDASKPRVTVQVNTGVARMPAHETEETTQLPIEDVEDDR